MNTHTDHVILTRFNLPSAGHESLVRAKENWLRDRIVLFERYCMPSVLAQSARDFTWIVYLDPGSPTWLRERVLAHERAGAYRALFREEVPGSVLIADIESVLGGRRREALLTTNLDNDDSLAADFLERVQAVRLDGRRMAIYVGEGLVAHEGAVYRHREASNAFCSVLEPWDEPVTCWVDWHNRLPQHMPAVVLDGGPGWLQVVHGTNVSNRVRGRRTDPSLHRGRFPGILDDAPTPTRREVAKDVLLGLPIRRARETARRMAKAIVVAFLGNGGIDGVKVRWAAVRHRSRGS